MKKITFAMVLITIVLSLGMSVFSSPLLANTENKSNAEMRDKYLNIMTVNKPQYDMVKKIIKDKHNVQYMFTDEKEISEFKYNASVLENVSNMDLFIYSGATFEPWANSFISELTKGNLGIINLSRGVRLLNYDEGATKENPYYFEGIDEYKIALCNVKAAIEDRDPKNRDFYEKNYNIAIKEFNDKLKSYDDKIKSLSDYTFITLNHDFDYLTKSLNLNIKELNNHELGEFIKSNNLDPKKVIVIVDGEQDPKINLSGYNTIKLWKYYGDWSFDDLILYNIDELAKWAKPADKSSTGSVA
ncbi:metal ABC transporter substrate-binding protein [Clostridium saccharobutylicum]|uniref:ABC-type metal ion transport system, periplasmic component/surface adhesin n=1 Tax=Clostridium saccharobutylicum DSM 13864 TaxID=1345695 RepID=U5MLW6_CLOSA|nr:zinc ABC transporter substrate-binding protein [Clostridium saccharobutylicum]AGX41590.1 ABC-type metal ion transport system, periplasmic component/surface adhesin [Clostridium saccharobutylicum DSM 13864]AQR88870.1 high-affinity zinc uptake system binding-protein ZnuA precursor [Clostridium saccharobutylicum]AQR98769.1 high-affinity zinc uptake system binding-protein ZnuA precursor [Clostridium saccharobutylicum]AQS08494.1 high-affinity zinc uptake system binding-protein ZnuA precursor [Clo